MFKALMASVVLSLAFLTSVSSANEPQRNNHNIAVQRAMQQAQLRRMRINQYNWSMYRQRPYYYHYHYHYQYRYYHYQPQYNCHPYYGLQYHYRSTPGIYFWFSF